MAKQKRELPGDWPCRDCDKYQAGKGCKSSREMWGCIMYRCWFRRTWRNLQYMLLPKGEERGNRNDITGIETIR